MPPDVVRMFAERFERDPRATHPYRLARLAEQATRFDGRALRRCHDAVLKTYADLVSSAMPDSLSLEMFLVKTLS
jgi:hypothetical protein